MSLLGYLVVIGLLDSLNPTATALQVYLLTTLNPIARSISFISGIFLSYWTVGLLVTLGLTNLITSVLGTLSEWLYIIQFVLGIVLIYVGYTLKPSTQSKQSQQNQHRSLHPFHTMLMGMSVTILEAPTALPYFAAIERLSKANLSLLETALFLGVYNLVFVAPLIVLLFIYITLQEKSSRLLRRINNAIEKWSPKILRILLLGIGTLLLADCIAYSLGYPFL